MIERMTMANADMTVLNSLLAVDSSHANAAGD